VGLHGHQRQLFAMMLCTMLSGRVPLLELRLLMLVFLLISLL
jgi:hypothetical protein